MIAGRIFFGGDFVKDSRPWLQTLSWKVLAFAFLLVVSDGFGAVRLTWTSQLKSPLNSFPLPQDITNSPATNFLLNVTTIDRKGNTYIGGMVFVYDWSGSVPRQSAFLAKYASDGRLVWLTDLPDSELSRMESLCSDSRGDLYVLLTSAESNSPIILKKVDSEGKLMWTKPDVSNPSLYTIPKARLIACGSDVVLVWVESEDDGSQALWLRRFSRKGDLKREEKLTVGFTAPNGIWGDTVTAAKDGTVWIGGADQDGGFLLKCPPQKPSKRFDLGPDPFATSVFRGKGGVVCVSGWGGTIFVGPNGKVLGRYEAEAGHCIGQGNDGEFLFESRDNIRLMALNRKGQVRWRKYDWRPLIGAVLHKNRIVAFHKGEGSGSVVLFNIQKNGAVESETEFRFSENLSPSSDEIVLSGSKRIRWISGKTGHSSNWFAPIVIRAFELR
jgi:hypothetical protein